MTLMDATRCSCRGHGTVSLAKPLACSVQGCPNRNFCPSPRLPSMTPWLPNGKTIGCCGTLDKQLHPSMPSSSQLAAPLSPLAILGITARTHPRQITRQRDREIPFVWQVQVSLRDQSVQTKCHDQRRDQANKVQPYFPAAAPLSPLLVVGNQPAERLTTHTPRRQE